MTKQKVIISKYGEASTLKMVTENTVRPNREEVRIKVFRAGVAYGDIMLRRGLFPFQKGKTPGFDVVGEVVEVGEAVSQWKKGDRVAALTITNGYSTYITLPASELIPVPQRVDLDQVSAVLLNYATAYQILKRHCQVKPGSRIFVQGLSGGLGNAFLDLKDEFEVHVYGTASKGKFDWVKARGGIAFDYREDYVSQFRAAVPQGADVVVDGIGGENFNLSYSLLSSQGHLVGIGYAGTSFWGWFASMFQLFSKNIFSGGRRATFYSIVFRKSKSPQDLMADIKYLLGLLQQGKINPYIHQVFPFEQVTEAHRVLEKGGVKGKVVLSMAEQA